MAKKKNPDSIPVRVFTFEIQEGIPESLANKLIRRTERDYLSDPEHHQVFSSVYDVPTFDTCSVVIDFEQRLGWMLRGCDLNKEAFPDAVEDGQHLGKGDALTPVLARQMSVRKMNVMSVEFTEQEVSAFKGKKR